MKTSDANEIVANTSIILMRDDFNSQLHPRMFDELCEQLGHDPRTTGELTLYIRESEAN